MRKKLLSVFLVSMSCALSAQSIQLRDTSNNVLNNDTITFTHYLDNNIFQSDFKHEEFIAVRNNSATDSMNIDLTRTEIEIIPGSGDYYCWGTQCLLERQAGNTPVWVANDPVKTGPMSDAGGLAPLAIYLSPNTFHGTALLKYTFTDLDNPRVNEASLYVRWVIIDTTAYSSPIVLFDSVKNNMNGDTLEFTDLLNNDIVQNDFEHTLDFPIFNGTGRSMNIDVEREEVQTINNSGDYFSWGTNSGSEVQAGASPKVLANSPVSTAARTEAKGNLPFKIYLNPDTEGGVAIYKYNFIDQLDPNNKASIVVKWTVRNVTSLGENSLTNKFSIAPNPVTNNTTINFEDALKYDQQSIEVLNIIGEKVQTIRLEKGARKVQVNTEEMSSGIYFVNIVVDGARVGSRKMIVK